MNMMIHPILHMKIMVTTVIIVHTLASTTDTLVIRITATGTIVILIILFHITATGTTAILIILFSIMTNAMRTTLIHSTTTIT